MPQAPTVSELFEFVLEKIPDAPLAKRARLYRQVAAHIGNMEESIRLLALANELAEFERKHVQLLIQFHRKDDSRSTLKEDSQ